MVRSVDPLWNQIHDHLIIPVTTNPLPAKVSDLWIHGTHEWNHQLIANTFSAEFTNSVSATQIIPNDSEDILRWHPATNGQCTSKNIYTYLSTHNTASLPATSPCSILPNANQILQKIWKCKTIPPIIKTFTWRLIRRALATAERAGRYTIHIDQCCSYCGSIENDFHLFFQCNLAKQVLVILNIITKSRLSSLNLVTVPKMPNLSLTPLKPSYHPQHDMRDAVLKYAIALLNK